MANQANPVEGEVGEGGIAVDDSGIPEDHMQDMPVEQVITDPGL